MKTKIKCCQFLINSRKTEQHPVKPKSKEKRRKKTCLSLDYETAKPPETGVEQRPEVKLQQEQENRGYYLRSFRLKRYSFH